MLNLVGNTAVLRVATSSANALHVQGSWVDRVDATGAQSTGSINIIQSAISAAPGTSVAGSPAAGATRNLKGLSLSAVGGANTIEVWHSDGTTPVRKVKVALLLDDVLTLTDGFGWQVYDVNGYEKQLSLSPGRFLWTQIISASGNYTPGAGATTAFVRAQGGGGAGGGVATAATSGGGGGGGGGGAYLERLIPVIAGTNYAAVIGAAGAPGAAGLNNGGAGGATTLTIGATVLTVPGGLGGIAGTAAVASINLGGDKTAVPTNGDLNIPGEAGDMGFNPTAAIVVSGKGGNSMFGAGGNSTKTQGNGAAGAGFGAGGSGGALVSAGASVAGGAGTIGIIVIDEYA
jgi:hypothetical protein